MVLEFVKFMTVSRQCSTEKERKTRDTRSLIEREIRWLSANQVIGRRKQVFLVNVIALGFVYRDVLANSAERNSAIIPSAIPIANDSSSFLPV